MIECFIFVTVPPSQFEKYGEEGVNSRVEALAELVDPEGWCELKIKKSDGANVRVVVKFPEESKWWRGVDPASMTSKEKK